MKGNGKGIIRPGQKTPFRKAGHLEVSERIDWLVDYFRQFWTASRFDIHKVMCKRYRLSWRQVDNYIACAKERLRKEAEITPQQAKRVGVAALNRLLESKSEQIVAKAVTVHADIFGYKAPARTELTGARGGPVRVEETTALPQLTRERLSELAAESGRNGE